MRWLADGAKTNTYFKGSVCFTKRLHLASGSTPLPLNESLQESNKTANKMGAIKSGWFSDPAPF